MQKIKQVPIRHLRIVISKHYLHYAHCISASLRLFETPSASRAEARGGRGWSNVVF